MANFIDTNMNQTVLMDINYLEQLGEDNFDFYLYPLLNQEDIVSDLYVMLQIRGHRLRGC